MDTFLWEIISQHHGKRKYVNHSAAMMRAAIGTLPHKKTSPNCSLQFHLALSGVSGDIADSPPHIQVGHMTRMK